MELGLPRARRARHSDSMGLAKVGSEGREQSGSLGGPVLHPGNGSGNGRSLASQDTLGRLLAPFCARHQRLGLASSAAAWLGLEDRTWSTPSQIVRASTTLALAGESSEIRAQAALDPEKIVFSIS